jgi:hypothetical protein
MTSQTATQQSTIIIEKRDEKNAVVDISPVKSVVYQKPNTSNTNSVDMVAYDKQVKPPTTSENIERTSTTFQTANMSINPVVEKQPTAENKTAAVTEHPQSSVRKQLIKDVPSTSTTISNNNTMSNSSAIQAKVSQKPTQSSKTQETKTSTNVQQQSNKSKPQNSLNNPQTSKSSTSLTTNLTDKNVSKAQADHQTSTSQPVNQTDLSSSTRNVVYESRAHKKLKPLSIEKNTLSVAVSSIIS